MTNRTCHNIWTYSGTKLNAKWGWHTYSFVAFFPVLSVPDQQCHAPYPSGSDRMWHFLSCSRTCRPCACSVDWLSLALGWFGSGRSQHMSVLHVSAYWHTLNTLAAETLLPHLPVQCSPIYESAFCVCVNVRRNRPFVLLVRAACSWRWVWSSGIMLAGKDWDFFLARQPSLA